MSHVPVLLHESIDGLHIQKGDIVVDATLGAGGHSCEIAKQFGQTVSIYGFDVDEEAQKKAVVRVEASGGKITPVTANFRSIESALKNEGVLQINRALFDLGVSSMELGASGRGFSFMHDEPLLMTLATTIDAGTLTAEDVVNSSSEQELVDILFSYGQERFARRIAKAIVTARKSTRITTTGELVAVIMSAVPAGYRHGRIHPATRTFQAIRIATNDELGALRDGLAGAWNVLASGGRIAVITFHSLEDRIVKNMFKEFSAAQGRLHTKKPIVPSREEIVRNPRSRSAKLRIIEKI